MATPGLPSATSASANLALATIQTMDEEGNCRHPVHNHSFQPISHNLRWRRCAACQERIQVVSAPLLLSAGSSSIVRCIACNCLVHRSCAGSRRQPCAAASGFSSVGQPNNLNSTADQVWAQGSWEEDGEDESVPTQSPTLSRGESSSLHEADECLNDEPAQQQTNNALHAATHPFAAVSKALQENILAHFASNRNNKDDSDLMEGEDFVDAALAVAPEPSTEASNTRRRLGTAALAGGIAGGVAGLVIAGPAGAYAGGKLGQVAGALGVLAEGSVTVGVLVASVATASRTAQHWEDERNRNVVLKETGTSQQVLLVRPNIEIDPEWEKIATTARASAPKQSLLDAAIGTVLRNRSSGWDSDIVHTSESEISTDDKVLLLVNRLLNDKTSVPGSVYRHLVESFTQRCHNDLLFRDNPRVRREDAHAVIKHVAATLLQARPELASSRNLTELTASAVEGLVFGQFYDVVMKEIMLECQDRSYALVKKVKKSLAASSTEQMDVEKPPSALIAQSVDEHISSLAINSLASLSNARTAVDKLYHCVRFLEHISDHFSSGVVCADSLLKMACQHLLVHIQDMPSTNLHAQVAFLEEFARDEQLLRGREGYSLVTLQAALHFLDMSETLNVADDDQIIHNWEGNNAS